MPTTPTALGGITAPTDADPVENGAAQIRSLAAQLDRLVKVKGADTVKNNSAALGDVSDFSFPVANGKKYAFRFALFLSAASAAADAALALNYSGTGTLSWGLSGLDTAASSATASAKLTSIVGAASDASITTGVPIGFIMAVIEGTFVATSAGTVKLRFAQATATAADSKVNAGSFMRVELAA